MAQSSDTAQISKASTEQVVVELVSYDGNAQVIVALEANQDSAHPPRLVHLFTQPVGGGGASSTPTTPSTIERETHVILSTGSGHRKASSFYHQVLAPVLKALEPAGQDGSTSVHVTQSENSILELVEQNLFPKANHGLSLRIILASGDGGIVDLVNGLLSKPSSSAYTAPHVVLLPLGTANALYHSMNVSPKQEQQQQQQQHTWGLHALSATQTQPLPLFKASFSPGARLLVDQGRAEEAVPTDSQGNAILHGAVVCSWAMHASLVADSDTAEYRKHGSQRFQMAAEEALHPSDRSTPHTYRAHLSVLRKGGETWEPVPQHDFIYLLATLVSHLEAPFCISPASRPLDGSLHLVHFAPMAAQEVMRIMGLAYAGGKHVDDERVTYEAVDGLRIAFDGMEGEERWRRICVDGKIVNVEEHGWVQVTKEKRSVVEMVFDQRQNASS